ncbi:MAG: DUF2541 family protein [Parvularculaceae bacterium]|jgi:hypothetical protein|nr:DUF2541 family protein [Parvularculaceae bacterium]
MKLKRSAVAAAIFATIATPALAAWTVIGVKEVSDRTENDTIVVEGARTFNRIKICVNRNPVRFIDVDVHFRNGGHQDIGVAERLNPGQCTRVIDLEGGNRDISRIEFRYEETSYRRGRAVVRVLAD